MPTVKPGLHGLITTDQAALLCGVSPVTVRGWINRGWHVDGEVRKLPVAWRYKGRIMLDPVEVAKADHATKEKARRVVVRTAA